MALVLSAAVVAGCGKSDSGGGSGGGGSSSGQKTPEEAFKGFKAAGEAGDIKVLWNSISKKTRDSFVDRTKKQLEEMNKKGDSEWEEAAKELGKTAAELKKMSAEDFTMMMMGREMTTPEEKEKAKKLVLDKVEMRGEVAILYTTKHNGKKDMAALVKEDGTWKMDMEESEKLDKEIDKLNEGK